MCAIPSNLQEIYCSIKSSHSESVELVPSLITNSVYYSSSGWGRLWKWFYSAVEWISGKDLKTDRLHQVIVKTKAAFDETLPSIIGHTKMYQSYLNKRLRGEKVDEGEIHESRKKITQWNRSATPFVDYVQYSDNPKIKAFYQKFFDCAAQEKGSIFSYGEEARSLKETQLLIDIEGYLHSPLPIPILVKISKQKDLSPRETRELDLWIDTLNHHANKIPVGLFLDCLQLLVERAGGMASLTSLHLHLLQKGLKIILLPDRDHQIWRGSLISGDTLAIGETQIVLGDKISERESGFRDNHIFAIEDDPYHFVAIGDNCAYWPLKNEIGEHHQWGIPMPAVEYLDPKGLFAIIEQLSPAIVENQWTTLQNRPNTPLSSEDEKTLTPIANLFRWWKKQSVCPENFSLNHLVFNASGSLKYTHALLPQPFDFRVLEDALFQISKEHIKVYQFLMEKSGLHQDITMHYYRAIVSRALNNEPLDAKKEALSRRITDPVVVERGNELYQSIQQMQQDLVSALKEEFEIPENVDKVLHAKLNEQLAIWYEGTYSASRIWPTVQPSVFKNLRRFLQRCKCPMTSS